MSSILDFKVTIKNGTYVSLVERMRELGYKLMLSFRVDGIINGDFLPAKVIYDEYPGCSGTKEEADEAWLLMHVHGNSFCEVVKRDLIEQIKSILDESENKNNAVD